MSNPKIKVSKRSWAAQLRQLIPRPFKAQNSSTDKGPTGYVSSLIPQIVAPIAPFQYWRGFHLGATRPTPSRTLTQS